jgi:hypothetical protein
MQSKVALIIIFNHKYDKNIAALEQIYKDRFTNIFFLIPFYTGTNIKVIPVYENSFYFQGYVAQGMKYFYREDFEHYFFIADDLILNPIINESNYKVHLKLNNSTSFLPGFASLHEMGTWTRVKDAYQFTLHKKGVEIINELPSLEKAMNNFNKLQLRLKPLKFKQIYNDSIFPKSFKALLKYLEWWYLRLKYVRKKINLDLKYPLVGSYADIFVISSDTIKEFCQYCGVFAATDLHVEVAIPTALALSTINISFEKDLMFQGKSLWTAEEHAELDKYNFNLNHLFNVFPPKYLYLHPVKLSKWTYS